LGIALTAARTGSAIRSIVRDEPSTTAMTRPRVTATANPMSTRWMVIHDSWSRKPGVRKNVSTTSAGDGT
jgi:hypothetical protein